VTDISKAVFLSYASQDAAAAQRLRDALCAAGIEVWFDENELRGGDAWDAKIRGQIRDCALFVPLISANTEARGEGYFRREWNLAAQRMLDMGDSRAFLLPVVIDGTTEVTADVPERFRERQWSRLESDAARRAFVTRVQRLLEPAATAPAASLATTPIAAGGTLIKHAPRRTNLPEALPPLFGRAQDLTEVQQMVREHRLVTLTGAGGIGKTQLARAAALALCDEFADGVWWVELASIADRAKVFTSVAQALGVNLPATRPPQQVLADVLSNQRLLLVIDNCEHVLESVALLADAVLGGAPGVRLLATSQEPLKLSPERHYRLGTLAIAATDNLAEAAQQGAVALFVERARAVAPKFKLTEQNLGAVIDICRQLDGIPLAIELAAARVPLLGINGLRDRLGERFRVLTGGSRFALRRHQALHAALDWSHGLLSPAEQAVFRRLGIFAGGCTLEAAQQVAADHEIDVWGVLEHLGALVDKSMLVVHGGDAPRYALLETTRAYGLEKLAQAGETEAMAKRHAQAMRTLFEQADEEHFGEQGALSEDDYNDRMQPEMDNLRAALAWAASADGDETLVIALATASSQNFLTVGAAAEGLAVLRPFIPRVDPADDSALATRFWFAVSFVGREGRVEDRVYVQAIERAEQGCRAQGWSRRLYLASLNKAWWLIRNHDFAAGESELEGAICLERPDWPGWLRSDRWNTQAMLYQQTGAFDSNEAASDRIAALLPPRGEERRQKRLILNRAVNWNSQSKWDQALSLLEPLVDDLRARRRHLGTAAWAYAHLVLALTQLGRLDDARERLQQALPLWRADSIVHVWIHLAIRLVCLQGRIADAMRMVGWEDASAHQFSRSEVIAARIRDESARLIEAAAPDPVQREVWRREGEALDEKGVVALCDPQRTEVHSASL